MLLGTVVQVPLDAAALGVAAGHDASPRGAQLVGLAPQLVERGLQGGVQLGVVKGQPDLAGQLGEDAVVLFAEADRAFGAGHHDRPEELAGVADRRDPDRAGSPPVQQRGHPDRGPGVARDAGVRDHRALTPGHDERARPDVGDRDGELEDFAGAGVDLRRLEGEGLAKRLGQLQEQLVHGYGPGQAAPEGAHHLVGGFACAVDETRRHAREAVPGGDVANRRDGGGDHRQAEHLAVGRPVGVLPRPRTTMR